MTTIKYNEKIRISIFETYSFETRTKRIYVEMFVCQSEKDSNYLTETKSNSFLHEELLVHSFVVVERLVN